MQPRTLAGSFHETWKESTWPIDDPANPLVRLGYIDLTTWRGAIYWRECDEAGLPLDLSIHGPYRSYESAIAAATHQLANAKES